LVIDRRETIRAVSAAVAAGTAPGIIATRFDGALADATIALAARRMAPGHRYPDGG
jgi:hypothetical protein